MSVLLLLKSCLLLSSAVPVSGEELCTLMGHTAEIVSLNFSMEGDQIITGSFDHTTKATLEPDSFTICGARSHA